MYQDHVWCVISCDAPWHLAQVLIFDTFQKPLHPTVHGNHQAWPACLWKKMFAKPLKEKKICLRQAPTPSSLWRTSSTCGGMISIIKDAAVRCGFLHNPAGSTLHLWRKTIVNSIYCKVLMRISIFQSCCKQKTKFGFDPGLLLMPWYRCIIGLTCEFRAVRALMASALDYRWLPVGPLDQERVGQLYQSGHKPVKLFLGHNYSEEWEVHHHVEDGMVLCDVEERLFSLDYMPLYMLCRWSGPKSVVAIQREQVNEHKCLVRTYKLSGEKLFEKELDATKSNWFSIAKHVHAEDNSMKNLMIVEGNVMIKRVWWPLRLDQTLPSKDESAMHVDILEDMWDGCCTEWGAVPCVARDDSFSRETSASPSCSSSPEPTQSSPRSRSRSREPDADIWKYKGKDKPQAIALHAASIQDACPKDLSDRRCCKYSFGSSKRLSRGCNVIVCTPWNRDWGRIRCKVHVQLVTSTKGLVLIIALWLKLSNKSWV